MAQAGGKEGGSQSYADCIEGLHYLEASYFLFSLKGRAGIRERAIEGGKEREKARALGE